MSEQSGEDRSEKATPKRMKEVRKDGSLQKSQDLSAWLGIGAAVVMLPMAFGQITDAAVNATQHLATIVRSPDPALAMTFLSQALQSVLPALAPMLAAGVIAAIVANAATGGIHISTKKLKPTFKQFDLLKGVKQKFGTQALWQGVKALLKTVVVGAVLYSVIQQLMPVLLSAGGLQLSAILEAAGNGINKLLWTAIAAGVVLAIVDVFVVMRRNRKKTRMTKKEIKDENKNTEGDPHVKGQIKSRQLAMSRNRMISNVADADVVVVNPTHVAVALKYVAGQGAPKLVAKGKGLIADKIRSEAQKHGVPMVSDIPLARALHQHCELDREVPEQLFNAVAQVLAFVMFLKNAVPPAQRSTP
ncbi:EscU/YscU/HrcU family type III secretion system export apparatus switch protein [Jonesiaceae bacterium BS-20]|uniref:EscU/YscU/HrcU family type III secretion system export apparatus switch protein n=1 Tax=Jonesiaceae bacterium BS-20 TaxID=3120821 RepID=A0AAU7DXY7_9MICO